MNSQHSSPKIHSRSATPTHSIARSNSAPVTSSSSPPGSSHAVHPTTSSEENCMPAGEVAYITRPSTFQDSLSESLLRHRHISEMAQKEADDVCHTESTSGSQMCLPSETTYSSGGTDKSQWYIFLLINSFFFFFKLSIYLYFLSNLTHIHTRTHTHFVIWWGVAMLFWDVNIFFFFKIIK